MKDPLLVARQEANAKAKGLESASKMAAVMQEELEAYTLSSASDTPLKCGDPEHRGPLISVDMHDRSVGTLRDILSAKEANATTLTSEIALLRKRTELQYKVIRRQHGQIESLTRECREWREMTETCYELETLAKGKA